MGRLGGIMISIVAPTQMLPTASPLSYPNLLISGYAMGANVVKDAKALPLIALKKAMATREAIAREPGRRPTHLYAAE
jgi:hypothetical protein